MHYRKERTAAGLRLQDLCKPCPCACLALDFPSVRQCLYLSIFSRVLRVLPAFSFCPQDVYWSSSPNNCQFLKEFTSLNSHTVSDRRPSTVSVPRSVGWETRHTWYQPSRSSRLPGKITHKSQNPADCGSLGQGLEQWRQSG